MKTISIANDFTKYPGGRYRKHGNGSGEEFRNRYLVPALQNNEPLTIILDGTVGYSSSFLEEAFGGLVRSGFGKELVHKLISIKASGPFLAYESLIWRYVDSSPSKNLG
ncbi:STAS-like domain-containing protein [Brucella thiophenivorans]|uniref:STAS-like domain-containing protein n=1 Tax=Brucella thiophenivorans TaxID=571255 RepID=UPI000B9990DB|nr:STAS-like domain-containing protein [Brucella thiophenivorans]